MYLIASLGIAFVLGYGTYLINTNHMTAGSFASFVTSLLLLYKPVKTLGNTLTNIQNLFVALGRVFELFDIDTDIKDCEKVPAATYVCMCSGDFSQEAENARTLLAYIEDMGYQIVGDYLCEAIIDFPVLEEKKRHIFSKIQIPVIL